MVATYNARARAAKLPTSQINAVLGNLFDKTDENPSHLSGPEYQSFDLATVGFGFHHFEDVTYAAKCLKNRLRPGGVLVINDFLEGGDLKADEQGNPIEGSEGDHTGHIHHHHHDDHKVSGSHHHGAHHHSHKEKKEDGPNTIVNELRAPHDTDDDPTKNVRKEMSASIVVPSFTIDGVKKFFTEAGFVDVDVIIMKDKVYMEFAGRKIWRTILFAKGRKPMEEKSEL
jgi:SAM-dependent methyltransferase